MVLPGQEQPITGVREPPKHTAGPWVTDGLTIQDDSGVHVIAECSEWLPEFQAERRANARLIAAAPDLLQAAQDLDARSRGDGPDVDISVLWDRLRTAIAKATS